MRSSVLPHAAAVMMGLPCGVATQPNYMAALSQANGIHTGSTTTQVV